MVSLQELPQLGVTFAVVAAVIVAAFLVIHGMGDSLVTGAAGCNSTDKTSCNAGYAAAQNLSAGMTNITTYAPTWGVILGVAALLGIVLAGFGYASKKGMI